MLHVVNLNMMAASMRHHPDGSPKDAAEAHRRDHILGLRQAKRARWATRFEHIWTFFAPTPDAKPVAIAVVKSCETVNAAC